MSYDLSLGLPDNRVTPSAEIKQLSFSGLHSGWPDMPDPILHMRNERIVTELLELNPHFEIFTECLDTWEGRMYELSLENGIQVSLYPRHAYIKLPYWYHRPSDAKRVFQEIHKYAQMIEEMTQYVTDDQQLGKVVDFKADLGRMVSVYLYGVDMTDKIVRRRRDSNPR